MVPWLFKPPELASPKRLPEVSTIKSPLGFKPILALKLAMVASILAVRVLFPKLRVMPTFHVPLLLTVEVATWVLPFHITIVAPGNPVPLRVWLAAPTVPETVVMLILLLAIEKGRLEFKRIFISAHLVMGQFVSKRCAPTLAKVLQS